MSPHPCSQEPSLVRCTQVGCRSQFPNSHSVSKAQILAELSQSFILKQPKPHSVHPGCTETAQSSSGDAVLDGFPSTANAGRARAKPYLTGKEMPNDFDDDLLVLVWGLVSRHNNFCAR